MEDSRTLFLFLLLLLLFPSAILCFYSQEEEEIVESLIQQACYNIHNAETCHANLQLESERQGRYGPNQILHITTNNSVFELQRTIDSVSKIVFLPRDTRESIAIEDCKELLEYSLEELELSFTEIRKIRTGLLGIDRIGDVKTWLSAALSNQESCIEGFEGTDENLKNQIGKELQHVTQLVSNLLAVFHSIHSIPIQSPFNAIKSTEGRKNGSAELPEWISDETHELFRLKRPLMQVDAVVALDGSGRYKSIMNAVKDAPNYSRRRYVIYVKKGIYRENVDVKKKKTNIMLVGDGIGRTIITGSRSYNQGWTTFRSATFAVSGQGFIARGITFRNTAGPENHQAVALRVDSDRSAFFRCSMEGYQDTLYAHSLRQFYSHCNIYGTIDFIFGNGAAVFQNCLIFTRKPLPYQKVVITAQGRKNPHQNTGFSIQNSRILASYPTYLGRPWKLYSRTVFMESFMSSQVQTRGWLEWSGSFALNTLYYGEYKNYGPGSSLKNRVQWPGFHVIQDASHATLFTVERFINGLTWLPRTGVRFFPGLTRS